MSNEIDYSETKRIPGKESEVKIASIQMEPIFGDKKGNLDKTLRMINEAADNGANVMVLPELCNTGYMFNSRAEAFSLAEEIPGGPATQAWIEAAKERGIYLAAGIAELDGDNLYNSAVLIGPDGYIGTHRKNCLWDEERMFFEWGDRGNQVFNTRIGRISLLVCFDMFFPENSVR